VTDSENAIINLPQKEPKRGPDMYQVKEFEVENDSVDTTH